MHAGRRGWDWECVVWCYISDSCFNILYLFNIVSRSACLVIFIASHLGLLSWSFNPRSNSTAALLQHSSYAVFVHSVGAKEIFIDWRRLVVRHLPALKPGVCALGGQFSRSLSDLRHLKTAQDVGGKDVL
jgi:hypothetical protein